MYKDRKSSLFLIELMLAILFFSLGSAVCVQAFVKAHTLSKSARDLSFASARASSVASVVKYTDGSLESFRTYFPNATSDGSRILICYDKTYRACTEEEAAYMLQVLTETTGKRASSQILMTDTEGKALYELQIQYPAVSPAQEDSYEP